MNQRKALTHKQLKTLKLMGLTKKELESLATIKTKKFYVRDGDNPGGLLKLEEDGTINDKR